MTKPDGGRNLAENGSNRMRKVEKMTQAWGLSEWKKGMENKKTLELYKNKDQLKRELWYDGSQGSKILFNARAGAWELKARIWRWSGEGEKCLNCWVGREMVSETIEHVILECEAYWQEREGLEEEMEQMVGAEIWSEVKSREDRGLAWLLGLQDEDEENIAGRMKIVKNFLKDVWRRRERMENSRREKRREERRVGVGLE